MTEMDDSLSAIYRRYLPPLAILLFLSLLALLGCEKKSSTEKAPDEARPAALKPEETKPAGINIKEIRLAVIPEDYDKLGNIIFSADGQQVFYAARKKDRDFIVVATKSGENIGPAYESRSFLVTSLDGRRFAFGGKKGKKKYLVVDNKELKALYYKEVAPSAFSPDGRLVACEVEDREKKEWFIVVSDGEKEVYRSRAYPDTFRQPSFSPNGRLLVYELGEKNKRIVFFFDLAARKIIKEWLCIDSERVGKISFSSDSSRVIFDAQKDGRNFLVLQDVALDEERKTEFPYTSAGQFVLSLDGEKIAYVVNKEGRHFLVVSPWESPAQGKESGPYEAVVPAIFSPDSTIVAYHAMKKGKWRIVVGDKEGPEYDGVGGSAVFTPDGAKIAYPVNKGGHQDKRGFIGGKWVMAVSPTGKPAAVKEGPLYDMVVTPVFSPDGRRIAYRARKGPMENAKRFIVIADAETGKVIKEGSVGDEIWPPVWSADGKATAYGARQGRELWWRVEAVK